MSGITKAQFDADEDNENAFKTAIASLMGSDYTTTNIGALTVVDSVRRRLSADDSAARRLAGDSVDVTYETTINTDDDDTTTTVKQVQNAIEQAIQNNEFQGAISNAVSVGGGSTELGSADVTDEPTFDTAQGMARSEEDGSGYNDKGNGSDDDDDAIKWWEDQDTLLIFGGVVVCAALAFALYHWFAKARASPTQAMGQPNSSEWQNPSVEFTTRRR